MKKVFILIFFFLILTAVFLTGFILLNNKNEKQPEILTDNNQDQICRLNEDCVPKEALMGIRYFCQERKCASEVLGNPASINCQEKGGVLDIRRDFRNQEYGVCVFQDMSECEEWKFFKGECAQGNFYLSGNIWNGEIISLRGAEFDDYFEMLNGDKIGIAGINEEISEILEVLRGKETIIKVKGEILNTAGDVSGKRLIVDKIIDMGDFKFKEISEEESVKIAKDAIAASNEYLDDKGVDLSLVKTAIQSVPYSWIFYFSYSYLSDSEKEVKVRVQEGEIKHIATIKKTEDELYNCDEFAFTKICSKDYNPVCAKIKKNVSKINPKLVIEEEFIIWKTFTNACAACFYYSETETVIGYKTGECE
ncbi:DUF333 domain-containing protein [Candidatus Parcubacteria bacterium]|nr:DUF333 domain-containing protein [Candidatus Parcubacteria bacterium]